MVSRRRSRFLSHNSQVFGVPESYQQLILKAGTGNPHPRVIQEFANWFMTILATYVYIYMYVCKKARVWTYERRNEINPKGPLHICIYIYMYLCKKARVWTYERRNEINPKSPLHIYVYIYIQVKSTCLSSNRMGISCMFQGKSC